MTRDTEYTHDGVFTHEHDGTTHVMLRLDDSEWRSLCGAREVECRWPHSAVRGLIGFSRPEDVSEMCGNCKRSM